MTAPRPLGTIIRAADLGLLLEARAVLDAARAEADAIRDAARGDGLRAGRAEGAAAATRLLAETAAGTRAALADAEVRVAQAVADAVARILGEAPPPATLAAATREAVRRLAAAGEVTVRVAPASLAATAEALADLTGVTAVPDPALGEADAIVEAPGGYVEAGLPAQLRALRRGLGLEDAA
ncbi:hypothetical protein ACE7GA_22340 [Roseomonas sp. CCTCC AB2023176]|uniref:hypothetical protein n=1 Tax=Roseomonas sp. CCTCC AB2023176 TaxID=3342640 RepID=UPI0035D9897D